MLKPTLEQIPNKENSHASILRRVKTLQRRRCLVELIAQNQDKVTTRYFLHTVIMLSDCIVCSGACHFLVRRPEVPPFYSVGLAAADRLSRPAGVRTVFDVVPGFGPVSCSVQTNSEPSAKVVAFIL